MNNDTFKWSFTGVTSLAVIFITPAIAGIISTRTIAFAAACSVAAMLLCFTTWRKSIPAITKEKISRDRRMVVECQ